MSIIDRPHITRCVNSTCEMAKDCLRHELYSRGGKGKKEKKAAYQGGEDCPEWLDLDWACKTCEGSSGATRKIIWGKTSAASYGKLTFKAAKVWGPSKQTATCPSCGAEFITDYR